MGLERFSVAAPRGRSGASPPQVCGLQHFLASRFTSASYLLSRFLAEAPRGRDSSRCTLPQERSSATASAAALQRRASCAWLPATWDNLLPLAVLAPLRVTNTKVKDILRHRGVCRSQGGTSSRRLCIDCSPSLPAGEVGVSSRLTRLGGASASASLSEASLSERAKICGPSVIVSTFARLPSRSSLRISVPMVLRASCTCLRSPTWRPAD